MGRTVMPISRAIEEEFQSWGKFRRALRKEDQEALEAMFCAAKFHVAAAAYASRLSPLEAILVSVLLEHQKALARLEQKLLAPEAPDEDKLREHGVPSLSPLPTSKPTRAAPCGEEPA